MIPKSEIQELYKRYSQEPAFVTRDQNLRQNSQAFRSFWKSKILNSAVKELNDESDLDPIILMLDAKAKGSGGREHYAVAATSVRQGAWRRMFKFLKNNKQLQGKLNEIFSAKDENDLIRLINEFHKLNEPFKNGMTGKNANALNAILVLRNPDDYTSVVSLRHRMEVVKKFGFGDIGGFEDLSYGEKIIRSTRWIIDGLRQDYGLAGTNRQLSSFLYWPETKPRWQDPKTEDEPEPEQDVEVAPFVSHVGSEHADSNSFVLEKHFEDFLIGNWDETDLGKKYDLIEEDGELVSQQYCTDIGRIDILTTDKKTGDYVVIELKKSQTCDDTIGQVLRYMGWVEEHKAKDKKVRGIIVALQDDARLRYALKRIKDIDFYLYKIHFSLDQIKI